ncbi:MAG: hypothetical protein EPO24_12225, partial [Bacteroidetes bacterium]
MASLKSNTAIAFYVDGLELKAAKLSTKKNSIVLEELVSANLMTRLDEIQTGESSGTADLGAEPAQEGFGTMATTEMQSDVGAGGDNNSVFLSILSKYQPGKYVLTYAISEPGLYYHTFETDFGLQG